MDRLIIKGGKMILPEEMAEGLSLVCRGRHIEIIVPDADILPEQGDSVIDASGKYVSPGFIDIHLHGGGGHDFMDGTADAFLGAARMHAVHGTTAMLPTTLTCSDRELFRVFEIFREASAKNTSGSKFLGLHLEGPYFNPSQAGAQDPEYLKLPLPENYMPLLDATDDIARWSVAPELEGAFRMGEELARRGILVSAGHSDAVYEDVLKASESGFSHITHLYSAMSTVTRKNARRYAGMVEAAYLIDDMTVEIIADGVHLPASLLQFVYRFKGPDKTALCTDAMRGAGMPDGEYLLGSLMNGQKVIVEEGVAKLPDRSAFAGSVATADRLVRTMVSYAGVPLCDAVKMMTSTPARIVGVGSSKGSLKPGMDADVVVFDDNIDISVTIIEGNVVYRK